MSKEFKKPQAGDFVVTRFRVNGMPFIGNETWFYNGVQLINNKGGEFKPVVAEKWDDAWDKDYHWRFASEEEKHDFMVDLQDNKLTIDFSDNTLKEFKWEYKIK